MKTLTQHIISALFIYTILMFFWVLATHVRFAFYVLAAVIVSVLIVMSFFN